MNTDKLTELKQATSERSISPYFYELVEELVRDYEEACVMNKKIFQQAIRANKGAKEIAEQIKVLSGILHDNEDEEEKTESDKVIK